MATSVSARKAPETSSDQPGTVQKVEFGIQTAAIVKILVAAFLAWALLTLVPTLLLIAVAVLLAMTIYPLVQRLETLGVRRSLANAAVILLVLTAVGLFAVFVLPPIIEQATELYGRLPEFRTQAESRLRGEHPFLATLAGQLLALPTSPEVAHWFRPAVWGGTAVQAVTAFVLMLALSFYLVVDGKRTYAWLLAYAPRAQRPRIALTAPAVCDVAVAYMQAQLLTSLLNGAFVLILLTLLDVPAAFPLALLAAVCDAIPVLGVILSAGPAALVALTVSPAAAATVVVGFLLYQIFENYVLIPWIYGNRLRLSPLAVLMAVLIGGSLYGVVGAILFLPIAAAYPIIEKIWLREALSEGTVADHAVLEQADGTQSDHVVEAVVRGRPVTGR